MDHVKILSIAIVLILVLNIALFAMKRIDTVTFWVAIIGCWIIAFKVIPKMRR